VAHNTTPLSASEIKTLNKYPLRIPRTSWRDQVRKNTQKKIGKKCIYRRSIYGRIEKKKEVLGKDNPFY
jgi:hypothetical protein